MRQQIKKTAIEITVIILLIAAIWYAFKISTFSALSESDNKGWLKVSEWLLIISAILVSLGLFGEFPESSTWKETVLYKTAKWGVIAGILLELLGDAGVFQAGDRIQELDGIAIAKANTAAADAITKATIVQEATAWRILNKDEFARLRTALSNKPARPIIVGFAVGDPETITFAVQIIAAFKGTNWQVMPLGHWYESQMVQGVHVLGSDTEGARLIEEALNAAQIPFSTDQVPEPSMYAGSSKIPDESKLFLYIGTKVQPKLAELLRAAGLPISIAPATGPKAQP